MCTVCSKSHLNFAAFCCQYSHVNKFVKPHCSVVICVVNMETPFTKLVINNTVTNK